MSKGKKIITRFPPSPTGGFHVGSARTALFNFLFAKQNDSIMILRFEDTDKERSKREYERDIVNALDWLGIQYEGGLRQSERVELYSSYIQKLLDSGHAYISDEKISETGEVGEERRRTVIRFKNPNADITFEDMIRGSITFNTKDLGDFVVAKSFDEPLYHLAVVVDDFEMGVTHIIRGDDHISNTPRQILIQRALGIDPMIYAHIPLILGPDKSKLSKRHGAKSVMEYKEDGILSEGLINYLALLGWNPGTDEEIFTIEELIERFDIRKVHKGGAIFNPDKLLWINKQHLNRLSPREYKDSASQYIPDDIKSLPLYSEEMVGRALHLIRDRVSSLSEIRALAMAGELEYFFEAPGYHSKSLMWKDETDIGNTQRHLKYIRSAISALDESTFTSSAVKASVWDYAEREGRGNVLWPMRYALSGMSKSPDPFTLAEVLGKNETLSRLNIAIQKIDQ